MKKQLLLIMLAIIFPLISWANIWQDPETKVNYEYTIGKSEASVKAGDNFAGEAGSPDVSDNVSILSSFIIDGNTYSVTSIGDYAFVNCYMMTSLSIPNSVTTIGDKIVSGCSALESLFVDSGNNYYDSRDNCNAIIETSTKTLIAGCKNTIIPNTVTSIGSAAFSECSGLVSITIPSNVSVIGFEAFSGCTKLASIIISEGVNSINNGAFKCCYSLTNIILPESLASIGMSAFEDCMDLTNISFPKNMTNIGSGAFAGCHNLTSITIPDGIKEIDSETFSNCDGLTSITFPESLTSIETAAFGGCTNLTDISFPESLTSIGYEAFVGCTNLTDISFPKSLTTIGPSAFIGCTELKSITILDRVTSIGSSAFSGCDKLTSITSYILEPFALEMHVFSDDCFSKATLYVPAFAVEAYQKTDGWNRFTILPIQDCNLSISLPDGTNVQDYAQMWLELTNTKSGQKMHYVMTDRTLYTFANIGSNTTWNVTLRNERGDVFGQIDNIEVKKEDVSVTFTSLSKPQNVSLFVKAPDGEDVTNKVTVTWTDASDNYLAQGTKLTGLPVGYQVKNRVILSQELAMTYYTPLAAEYTLQDGDNKITCQLEAIKQIQLSGKVKDATTGLPLSGVVISASQTFGGKYSKTTNVKTDGNGVFTLDIACVPTSMAFAATDYISQTIEYSNDEFDGLNEFSVPDVSLKSITGATISLEFTYTTCDGETQHWYNDYQNISYELFNVTKNQTISQYNVQYPQIVLLEDVDDGDVLRLTATSRTNAFKAVETTATIEEQKATASFDITELGKIQASYAQTDNAAVVGSLYDASGKLVKTYNYSDAQLTINSLTDGQYTLVSMGSSRLFNTIYDLAQLPQTGLTDGTDYVQNTVEVRSGAISQINIEQVPTFDESKLYYTGDNTSFTGNKSSVVIGNYITLTGRIDFKSAYATSVSNVQMIVDLPESCEFVENSVMVGNSTGIYTLNGNQINIPMANSTDRVRLCVIPTHSGEYTPSAFAKFDLNDETVTQPIGSVNYTAKDLSINVPTTTAKTAIPVSGTVNGTSSVDIYDNGIMIGHTTSQANGIWATMCELNEPYNLTFHNIYAKITTIAGIELQSETVGCLYDMASAEVSTVTMINTAHPASSLNTCEYVTVFDFQNPQNDIPAYWYWPSYPSFTYITKFTSGSQNNVENVYVNVKTSSGDVVPLKCTYDSKSDGWIASQNFYSGNLPVNVSVGYDTKDLDINSDLVNSTIQGNLLQNNTQAKQKIDSQTTQTSENSFKTTTRIGNVDLSINTQMSIENSISNKYSYEALPASETEKIYLKFNAVTGVMEMLLPSHICRTIGGMLFANSNEQEQLMAICESMDENDVLHVQSYIEEHAPAGVNAIFGIVEKLVSFSDRARHCYNMIQRQKQKLLRMRNCDLMGNEEKLDNYNEALNNLFDQYFRIEAMSTGMQCITVGNTNPLAVIPLMGSLFEATAELTLRHRLIDIGNNIKTFEDLCKRAGQYMSDEEVESMCGNVAYIMDPSGYVYESVPSNRLEGVTATAYYKEMVEDMYGDQHENIVKWDASEYAQENPLYTDEYGMYAWDVPQGLWQVKFEKEGYETVYSEWLPVPPPQLDVNIEMRQSKQPEVKNARAFEDAVEVEFDKYMMPELLTTENIIVMQNGEAVEGSVELLNSEAVTEGSNETFASKVRFNATQPFMEQEVTLMVRNRVKSYTGTPMQDNYQQTFFVEQEMKQIVSDEQTVVGYGENATLTVSVLPASASKGKMLNVKTSSPMILGVEAEQVIIGNDGKAEITVSGELPGTAALTFSVEGTDKTAITIANVEQKIHETVATPTASISSGQIVGSGTQIILTCDTEGATIYYTLDGSCPCDETSRYVYDGPITISSDITIKAIAVKDGMEDSEVVNFTYTVIESVVLDEESTTAPVKAANVDVCVKRTIKADEWSTLCLPFDMTESQVTTAFGDDVALGDFTGYDVTKENNEIVGINVYFESVTAIEANRPYIIKVPELVTEFSVEGVTIEPKDNPCVSFGYNTTMPLVYHPKDFRGTYVADFDFYHEALSYPLFLSGNKFYYATENTKFMKAFRAFFDFEDYLPEAAGGASARIMMSFGGESTDIGSELNAQSSMCNAVYDLQGRRVTRPVKKGVYVREGRKVLIK